MVAVLSIDRAIATLTLWINSLARSHLIAESHLLRVIELTLQLVLGSVSTLTCAFVCGRAADANEIG